MAPQGLRIRYGQIMWCFTHESGRFPSDERMLNIRAKEGIAQAGERSRGAEASGIQ